MNIKINPVIMVTIFGTLGLIFNFIDNTGNIGGKIPLTIFFIILIIVGIILQIYPPEKNDSFGEVGRPKDSLA